MNSALLFLSFLLFSNFTLFTSPQELVSLQGAGGLLLDTERLRAAQYQGEVVNKVETASLTATPQVLGVGFSSESREAAAVVSSLKENPGTVTTPPNERGNKEHKEHDMPEPAVPLRQEHPSALYPLKREPAFIRESLKQEPLEQEPASVLLKREPTSILKQEPLKWEPTSAFLEPLKRESTSALKQEPLKWEPASALLDPLKQESTKQEPLKWEPEQESLKWEPKKPESPMLALETPSRHDRADDLKQTSREATIHERRKNAHGYILAANYYEQQTMASRNMIQLQCYAKHLNLAVVKPVTRDSFLRTLLSEVDAPPKGEWLQFEDSFDLEEWQDQSKRAGYTPLVGWDQFLADAPRDIVLCRFNYPSLAVINERKKAGPVTQRAQNDRYTKGCSEKWPSSSEMAFLRDRGFKIVREVCFNFYHGDTLTREEFDTHLMGGVNSSDVTVVMDLWRGMGSSQRVLVQDRCAAVYAFHEHVQLSRRLAQDAETYIQTHLRGGPFVTVMGRMEMALLTVHTKQFSPSLCFRAILSDLLKLKESVHINTTFLSIDIGTYGTKKWRNHSDKELLSELESFVGSVYGREATVRSWEASFEEVSSSRDAGYVSLLQKAVVTRARCVLFAGGGAFQRHTLHLYQQLNSDRNSWCLRIVKQCTSPTKLTL